MHYKEKLVVPLLVRRITHWSVILYATLVLEMTQFKAITWPTRLEGDFS